MAESTTDRNAVSGVYARKVLQYGDVIERIVRAAKEPGFDASGWDELAALLDTARFERVGNDKVKRGWDAYRDELLTPWATTTDFWSEFRRISEVGKLVVLELTEHNTQRGGAESVVNSCTLYEFDDAGKLVHLDIYISSTIEQGRPMGGAGGTDAPVPRFSVFPKVPPVPTSPRPWPARSTLSSTRRRPSPRTGGRGSTIISRTRSRRASCSPAPR